MEKKEKAGASTFQKGVVSCDCGSMEDVKADLLAVAGLLELLYLVTDGGLWNEAAQDDVSMCILKARNTLREIEKTLTWS